MGRTWDNIKLTDNTVPVGVHLILGTQQTEKRRLNYTLMMFMCASYFAITPNPERMNSLGPPTFMPSLDYVKIIKIPF